MKPAIFSAGLFQFMWTWNQVLAMALVTVVPLIVLLVQNFEHYKY